MMPETPAEERAFAALDAMNEAFARFDLPDPDAVPESLIHYVMDLEALVRWFALPFRYQDQEGVWHQNEPIWTVHDERGNYLPEADRLQRTWNRAMNEA